MNKRSSGILLHISSLPSPYGIGDLGPFAYAFVDFLKNAGQRYWQILPLNPTDGINGHSPYSCFSAFAGNALFISPVMMVAEGFCRSHDLEKAPAFGADKVDYAKVIPFKEELFHTAFKQFKKAKPAPDYIEFIEANHDWLQDFALFTVIKQELKGRCWNEWPKPLKSRDRQALERFAKDHADAVDEVKFIQYLFSRQWQKLKAYANAHGVQIIGDIPIYVDYDSVDVWCHPSFFKLDGQGHLKFVSGCPPDYFSKTGQRWGNPVYDWANLKKSKYSWWVKRIAHNLSLFDQLRIDHFRGFLSFWQIPAHERLAVFGRWVKGPGDHFFNALAKRFTPLPLIAEDLGEITPDVIDLMKKFKFPGMRVLLFAFGGDPKTNPYVPANYPVHCVAYTGTHDNNTVQGWWRHEAKHHERMNAAHILGKKLNAKDIHWVMIKALLKSNAQIVIVPMPDVLGLGQEARMNTPATKVNNWQWRLRARAVNAPLSHKILELTHRSKR